MEKETIEVIRDRKQFYIQEGEIELRNATDFLHAKCDDWNDECERTFGELLGRAAGYLQKAAAMNELLTPFQRYPLIVVSKKVGWNELTPIQKLMAERQYRAIRSEEEQIPEEDVDVGMLPECRSFDVTVYDNGDQTVEVDI